MLIKLDTHYVCCLNNIVERSEKSKINIFLIKAIKLIIRALLKTMSKTEFTFAQNIFAKENTTSVVVKICRRTCGRKMESSLNFRLGLKKKFGKFLIFFKERL